MADASRGISSQGKEKKTDGDTDQLRSIRGTH